MDPVNNKVKSKYWNALSETIGTIKPDDLYYGIQHFTIYGQLSPGMIETFYSKQISPIHRIKFLEKYGPCMLGISDKILKEVGDSLIRESPSNKLIIYSMSLLRRFIRSNRDEKKLLLINKLGFDELGLRITNGSTITEQFLYKYSTHPTQLEIYLETDETGQVKEINIFNNSNMEELRIPLSLDGLVYTFIQVISDLYKVNFDKFDPINMDKKYSELNKKIIDFESSFPEFDNLDLAEIVEELEENKNLNSDMLKLDIEKLFDITLRKHDLNNIINMISNEKFIISQKNVIKWYKDELIEQIQNIPDEIIDVTSEHMKGNLWNDDFLQNQESIKITLNERQIFFIYSVFKTSDDMTKNTNVKQIFSQVTKLFKQKIDIINNSQESKNNFDSIVLTSEEKTIINESEQVETIKINLTPSKYLDTEARYLRAKLINNELNSSDIKLEVMYDKYNNNDLQALEVYNNGVMIGHIQKYDSSINIDEFCFINEKKINSLILEWKNNKFYLSKKLSYSEQEEIKQLKKEKDEKDIKQKIEEEHRRKKREEDDKKKEQKERIEQIRREDEQRRIKEKREQEKFERKIYLASPAGVQETTNTTWKWIFILIVGVAILDAIFNDINW